MVMALSPWCIIAAAVVDAVVVAGDVGAVSSSSSIRITRRRGDAAPASSSPTLVLLDATNVVRDFVLDEMGPLADVNASYALSDIARFARPSWDCGALGTQGSLLAEKLLSLGFPKHLKLVRRWLLNNPILPSGEVFSTEGGLLPCWAATAVLYAVGDHEQQDQHQGRQLLPPVYSQEIVVTSHTLQWFDLTLDHALPARR